MRFPRQTLVVPDGSGLLQPPAASWTWPRGSDVFFPVRVVHQDGTPYDLSGAVAAVLGWKEKETDDATVLQVEWTITSDVAGLAEFPLPRSLAPDLPEAEYATSVQFRDDDAGVEDAILLIGRSIITPTVASFDDPVAEIATQQPLARGPSGFYGAYATVDRPAPSAVPEGRYIWDTNLHLPLFSDGASIWYDAAGNDVT